MTKPFSDTIVAPEICPPCTGNCRQGRDCPVNQRASKADRRIVLTIMALSIGLSLGVVGLVAIAAFIAGRT